MAYRRSTPFVPLLGMLTLLTLCSFSGSAVAANRAGSPTAATRVVDALDEAKLVSLAGHTHPLASAKYNQGPVSESLPMEHMFLQLRRGAEQEDALQRAIAEREDPAIRQLSPMDDSRGDRNEIRPG